MLNDPTRATDSDHVCCDGDAVSGAADCDGEHCRANAVDDDFVIHLK